MAWFKVDDKLHDHPKIRKLRGHKMACLGLWTACGSWSADNLSDGFVPCEIVHRFDPDESLAKRLVEVGLWIQFEHDGEEGYLFHQWTDHQPSRAEVERRREEARERMRRRRAGTSTEHSANFADGSQDVRANTSRTAREVRHPDPSRPDPTRPEERLPLAPLAASDVAAFDEFYAAYPRREDRKSAERAWKRAMKAKADPQHVIAAARRYAEQTRETERRFIKLPATWLNAGAYDNETSAPQLRAVSGGYQPYRNPADPSVWDEPLLPPNSQENP